jgi:hypothetical protein
MGGSNLPCRGREAPQSALDKVSRETARIVNRTMKSGSSSALAIDLITLYDGFAVSNRFDMLWSFLTKPLCK